MPIPAAPAPGNCFEKKWGKIKDEFRAKTMFFNGFGTEFGRF